jgi:tetratricopeptide (TPR) repeat protein
LLNPATGDFLFTKIWEGNGEKNPVETVVKEISEKIYSILNASDWSDIVQARVDPGMRNEVAREAILAGREVVRSNTVVDFDNAIRLYTKATQAEPASALAHAYLAMAATARLHYHTDQSFLDLGKTEADKALLLAPDLAEAHKSKAGVCYQQGKFSEALEEQLRAVESAGLEERIIFFIGQTLDMLGWPDQALNWYALPSRGARTPGERDSLVGDCWTKLTDDEKALEAYNRALEYRPDFSEGLIGIAHLRLLQGDFDGARETLQSSAGKRNDPADTEQIAAQIEFFARDFRAAERLYVDLAKSNAEGGGSYYGAVTYRSALGRAKQAIGDEKGAQGILDACLKKETAALDMAPNNPEVAYRLAAVEASLAMPEAALRHLHTASTSGWIDYRSLELDPRFDSLRDNPLFHKIIHDLSVKVADMRSRRNNNN